MKKIEIKNESNKYKNIKLTFHDVLLGTETFNYITKKLKHWTLYILLINWYFVLKTIINVFKQTANSLWKDYFNNYFRYWTIIYLLPLIALGIVLPAALSKVLLHQWINFLIWISWLWISCVFFICVTPYSLILLLLIYKKRLTHKYNNQLKKVEIRN